MALLDANLATTTTALAGMEVKVLNTKGPRQGLVVCKSSEVYVIGVMAF